MAPTTSKPADFEDEFVNIWVDKEASAPAGNSSTPDFHKTWTEKVSAPSNHPPVFSADALRRQYPKHSLVMTNAYNTDVLSFQGAQVTPLEPSQLVTNSYFIPLNRSYGIPGVLADSVVYGAFKVVWREYEFIVYIIQYPQGFGIYTQRFILHEGPEEISRLFLLSVGAQYESLQDEIWVFNQGFWQKDTALWREVQKSNWDDVILKQNFKDNLKKDVYGFFSSEELYKNLGIPWKRGLIMYGPPGNGKTISLKTIMKDCGALGYAPLYVKSFQSYKGEEGAMQDVFDKARQLSPCVVVFEDLDSLITDRNRSFFLNQLDGLSGNDGLLIIGTTNHFEKLDPALSTRPSRFDRKFKFDDPDEEERKLYAQYWQNKLAANKDIEFPDTLVDEVAKSTEKFSFAYLKEAFVSTLVLIANQEGEKPKFEKILKKTIETLRKQLEKNLTKSRPFSARNPPTMHDVSEITRQSQARSSAFREQRRQLEAELNKLERDAGIDAAASARMYDSLNPPPNGPGITTRDYRSLLDSLSDSLGSLSPPFYPSFDDILPSRHSDDSLAAHGDGRNYRALLDRIASQNERINNIIADSRFYSSRSARGLGRQSNEVANPNGPPAFMGNPTAHPRGQFSCLPGASPPFGNDLA